MIGRGFRLGKILGLEVSVDLSWLVILALVVWSFTAAVFPSVAPELSASTYVAMGVTGAVLFFVSLLIHEIAHSLVARAKGIPVEGITLFIFGGVSRMRSEAGNPGDEFVIAGVGPLTSLVLAGLFLVVAVVAPALGWGVAVTEVARYLSLLNVALAVFNLLPGFPLDGGRLFRAAVWHFTGDLEKATRAATTGGKALGLLLVFGGLWQVFGGNVLGGMWLVFIGWFLNNAAEMSYRQHVVRAGLEGALARDAMTRDPLVVDAGLTLRELVDEHFLHGPQSAYPVMDDGSVVGVVTVGHATERPREEWSELLVRDVLLVLDDRMRVAPDESLVGVLETFQDAPVDVLLVVEDGALRGTLTPRDVTEWLALASGTVAREELANELAG